MNSLEHISKVDDPKVLTAYVQAMYKELYKRFTDWMVCEISDKTLDRITDHPDRHGYHGYIKAMDETLRKRFTDDLVEEIEKDALDSAQGIQR